MPFPKYEIPTELPNGCDAEQLDAELTAAPGVTAHDGVSVSTDPADEGRGWLVVHGVDPAEAEAVEAVVAAHAAPTWLEDARQEAVEQVWTELRRRLEDDITVEYPTESGKLWRACVRSRDHWRSARDQARAGSLEYPFIRRTRDGLDFHAFASATEVEELTDLLDAQLLAQQAEAEAVIAEVATSTDEADVIAALDAYLEDDR